MKTHQGVIIVLLAFALSACTSTTQRDYEACIVGSSAVGGIAGSSNGAGTVVGVAVGAGLGAVICRYDPPPADSDGDGVTDDRDSCPGTAPGVAVDARGCALDSDGDGVDDASDRCPGTPAGVAVDARGCPRDSDGDGVTDDRDRCPDTAANVEVDSRGCPEEGEVLLTFDEITFAFDSAELDARSKVALDNAAAVIRNNAAVNLELVGHTDSTGPASYNQSLSERRAKAVLDYLVSKGISADTLTASGRGESQPVASNDTRDGRAENRRVELVVR